MPPVGPEDGIKNLGADLLLVGGDAQQRLDWRRLEQAFADEALARELRSTLVLSDPMAVAATWTMGREELERFAEDKAAFPGGTPLNTDDNPSLEFVAPRRTVVRPSSGSIPWTRPRLDVRSPMMSPTYSSGTLISAVM